MLPCSVLKEEEEEEEEEEDLYFDTNIRKAYNVVGSCVKKKNNDKKSINYKKNNKNKNSYSIIYVHYLQ